MSKALRTSQKAQHLSSRQEALQAWLTAIYQLRLKIYWQCSYDGDPEFPITNLAIYVPNNGAKI
jgi:hypothetical protein